MLASMTDEPPMLARQAVRDLLWAFRRTVGDEAVDEGLAALPDEVRERYTDSSSLAWLPYETVVEAHQAIATRAGVTMEALLEQAVPIATERAFKTVWRVFLRLTSNEQLVKRAPVIYSRSRSRGEMRVVSVEEGAARLEVIDWPEIPPRDVLSLGLSVQTFLRLAGRREATVSGRITPTGASFEVRWVPEG